VSTILLLDDEHAILTLVARILEPMGHDLLRASNAAEALDCFDERDGAIDLLIADVNLQQTSGVEVAVELRSLLPNLRIVFMSGRTPDGWSEQDRALMDELPSECVLFLAKPFTANDLRRAVAVFAGASPHPALVDAAGARFRRRGALT
jgi:two-component system, cell cycle sensor histidine kinase and response regulator CckA